MNYLLDTHVVIWSITDNQNYLGSLRDEIKNLDNNCFVSIASLWEMSIKYSLNKLDLKSSLKEIFGTIESSAFRILPVTTNHLFKLSELELHHRDPFDRLLIAQAKAENLTIITKDTAFTSYHVNLKWN